MTELVQPTPAAPGWVEVQTTEIGWLPQGDMPFEQWEQAGRRLLRVGRAVQFWIGDWILYGERNYGDTYRTAIDRTGYEYQTLANIVTVCREIESSRRREQLTFTHHAEVAPLEHGRQEELLDRAVTEGWSTAHLRTECRQLRAETPAPSPPPASTFVAEVSFVYAADDDAGARAKLDDIVKRMERQGLSVTFKRVQERHS